MNYNHRILETRLRQLALHFPIILVTGARQVGKTTLVRHLFGETARLFVFDPIQDLYGARLDPELFLSQHKPPLLLDDVQFAPELLPGIKRHVDARPGPGQYILTGSQNLALLKGVAESLAGRVAILDLEPMTGSERQGVAHSAGWLGAWLEDPEKVLKSPPRRRHGENLWRALWRGGFPGLLELPDELVPDFFASYIRTYVERDARLAGEVSDWQQFARFLALCAALTGQEVNHSQLGRDLGVTPQTAHRWLATLSATYVRMEAAPYHGNALKRISRRPKGYLIDTGIAAHLQRLSSPQAVSVSPLAGALFETMVVGEIRRMATAIYPAANLYHWRSHGGAEVDLLLDLDGELWPVEIKCSTRISGADERNFRALRDTYPQARIRPNLILAAVEDARRLSVETLILPWDTL